MLDQLQNVGKHSGGKFELYLFVYNHFRYPSRYRKLQLQKITENLSHICLYAIISAIPAATGQEYYPPPEGVVSETLELEIKKFENVVGKKRLPEGI